MSADEGSPAQPSEQDGTAGSATTPSPLFWKVTVLRALPAVIVGLIITFLEDHSSRVGLISFGAFAVISGVIVFVGAARYLTDRVVRGSFFAHGVISVLAGVASLLLWNTNIAVFLLIVTMFAATTGVLEIYAGLRARGSLFARDWVTVGAFTALAAIVFVLIPPDSILATGLIGAYGMILGVFLVIAGLSQKWANDKPAVTKQPAGTEQTRNGKASE